MGVLAPLFLAGLAGLSVPVILHLIRRTPREHVQFSSLMFLTPTPPRLSRRSRLDQILLLVLRLAVLGLLAFAFARPFLRDSALLSLNDLPQRRVAILVDTSASMNRGDLWQQAVKAVQSELNELGPQDEVALYRFADQVVPVVPFAKDDKREGGVSSAELVRREMDRLQPGWLHGDLGAALVSVAAELDASNDVQQSLADPRLVVVSDFQHGSRIEALQGFTWPSRVRVTAKTVAPTRPSNAAVQVLVDDAASNSVPRVRVVNAPDSTQDQFFVHWQHPKQPDSTEGETAIYVPPGQTRVLQLPRRESALLSDRVVLRGDDQDFDNTFYVVPPRQRKMTVAYFGADAADDPQGLQYYLRLATGNDPLRKAEVVALEPNDPKPLGDPKPELIVLTSSPSAAGLDELKTYVVNGGHLVVAPKDRAAAEVLTSFFPDIESISEATRSEADFSLLGEIDFTHPFFAVFSNPRYNDFTKIHFWKQRSVKLAADHPTNVVARFDNGDPWLLERPSGKGRVWAFTSGWQPDDSQLAVSSKFVPLINNLLDAAAGSVQKLSGIVVGSPVPLPTQAPPLSVTAPDGQAIKVAAGDAQFRDTPRPGVYHAGSGDDAWAFAVNLDPRESETQPLAMESLEQLGLKFGDEGTQNDRLERIRLARDTELESLQQLWRWLIVAGLSILILETWWSSRISRSTTGLTAKANVMEAVA
jgi:hypothetical protein